jgi:hypothetical protein
MRKLVSFGGTFIIGLFFLFGADELGEVPLFPLDFYFAAVLCILDAFSGNWTFIMVYAEIF